VNLDYENGSWKLDLENLAKLLSPKTKIIMLNTPHNPVEDIVFIFTKNMIIKIMHHILYNFLKIIIRLAKYLHKKNKNKLRICSKRIQELLFNLTKYIQTSLMIINSILDLPSSQTCLIEQLRFIVWEKCLAQQDEEQDLQWVQKN